MSHDNGSVSPQAGSHTGTRGRALGQDSEAPGFLWDHSYRGSPRNHYGGQAALEGKSKFSEGTGSAHCRYVRLLHEKGAVAYTLLLHSHHHAQALSRNLSRKCAEKKGVNRWQKLKCFIAFDSIKYLLSQYL